MFLMTAKEFTFRIDDGIFVVVVAMDFFVLEDFSQLDSIDECSCCEVCVAFFGISRDGGIPVP